MSEHCTNCNHEHHHDHDHHHGHDHGHEHGDREENQLPGIILSMVMGIIAYIITKTKVSAYVMPDFIAGKWRTSLVIAIWVIVYLVASFDVLKEAVERIFHGNFFNEEVLMAIATVGAMVIGEYPEAVAVMLFYRVGELFEDRAVDKSRDAIVSLMDIRPDSASVIRNGEEIKVSPDEVEIGETIIVRPGEKIPLDGVVVSGNAGINSAALTGESRISDVSEGDRVISGSLDVNGVITVKTSSVFGESTVSKILRLVEDSSEKKAKTENFISKFAKYYTPAVVACALIIAIVPSLITNECPKWIYRALTFLVVSCPCALVVSVPLTFFAGIGCASKNGILIKGSNYIETLAKADTVVLDKTGTLTKGNFAIEAVHSSKVSEAELLDIAAAVESYSAHPVAESIIAARNGHIDKSRIGSVREIAGKGIEACVDGKIYYVGNDSLMEEAGADRHDCHLVGTIVHVSCGNEYLGHIVINDSLKPDAAEAVASMRNEGIKNIYMLTGDDAKVATNIAEKTGITSFEAKLFPEDKIGFVEKYMQNGGKVIFAGDGINDAPVLMRADCGIAMGALGSDAAIEAADVVIMDDAPSKIPTAISIAKRTLRIAKQNIIFALAVKIIILILSGLGITNMWLAVFGDVGVLVLAVLNALRAARTSR